jgi:hypothetical protein
VLLAVLHALRAQHLGPPSGLAAAAAAAGAPAAGAAHAAPAAGTAGPATAATDSYALTVPDVGVDVRGPDEAYARKILGTVRIRATAADPAKPVFVGIAPTRDVDAYLDGVGHADVSDIEVDPVEVKYAPSDGGPPASAPTEQTFWDASDSGTGTRTMEWELATGDWTVVVMNADGSSGVRADLDLGGELPGLGWVTVALITLGAVLLLGGALLVILPLTVGRRHA